MFQNCLKFHSPKRLVKLRTTISNITRSIYAKYHYKSCYCRYKFCITIVFDFFPGDRNTQKKFKTMVMQNLGGKQGALWSMRKWCIALNDFTGEGCNHLITKNNA